MQNPFPGSGVDDPEREAGIICGRISGAITAFLYTPDVHGWAVHLCTDIVRDRYAEAGVPWVAPVLWIVTPIFIYSFVKQVVAAIIINLMSKKRRF